MGPQQCKWAQDGFKVLGVFFGTAQYSEKNWEGLANRVIGRLQKWRWLLRQLSFRGRCLIINNLSASVLWHRVTVLNPPKEMLITLQTAFVDFFWNGLHCLIPGILYLPVAEGAQGLIHIESEISAMRLQTLQRLLYCSAPVQWVTSGLSVLTDLGGIGLDKQFFLMEKHFPYFEERAHCLFPNFDLSVIKSWKYLLEQKMCTMGFQNLCFLTPL